MGWGREMKGGIKGRWTGTHSASTWATGHLYCAVLNRQISAYCRTVGREQGHTEGLAKLESVHTHGQKLLKSINKFYNPCIYTYTQCICYQYPSLLIPPECLQISINTDADKQTYLKYRGGAINNGSKRLVKYFKNSITSSINTLTNRCFCFNTHNY